MRSRQPTKVPGFEKKLNNHTEGMLRTISASGGLRVRTDLRAGAWKCRDCSGTPVSNGLYKAKCDVCVR
jgi:hypothetical protein